MIMDYATLFDITFGAESDFAVYFALSWIVFLCLFVFLLLLFCKSSRNFQFN